MSFVKFGVLKLENEVVDKNGSYVDCSGGGSKHIVCAVCVPYFTCNITAVVQCSRGHARCSRAYTQFRCRASCSSVVRLSAANGRTTSKHNQLGNTIPVHLEVVLLVTAFSCERMAVVENLNLKPTMQLTPTTSRSLSASFRQTNRHHSLFFAK